MTDREKIIEIISPFISAYGEDEAIADALITAGIGDVAEWKERAEKHRFMALPDGRIKQLYSDEEVEWIVKERDEYKHRAEIAELVCDAMRETLFTADGGCDEICPLWDNECIRLKAAVYCKEAQWSDRIAHCVERWKQYALEEYVKPKEK